MTALLYLLVVLIWGTTWIAITLQQQADVAITVSIFYRFALAAGTMMIVLLLARRLRQLAVRDHLFCVAQGICVFAFNFYCFYHAAAYISSGLESVIFSMAVLFNAINGMIFFRQRLSPNLLPASILGMIGIVALFWQDLTATQMAPELLKGIGLSLLGTYGFSLGNMISSRHQRKGLDILSTNAYAMTYGAVAMGLFSLIQQHSFALEFTPRYLGSLLYLAIFGSVIAFAAYFSLIGRIGASGAAYSTLLFPLVALTISTIYEGYHWHLNAIIGLLLILLGNLVMFSRPGMVQSWFKRRHYSLPQR
ncbi:putative inner membrane protein [Yersinia intermedia]|uniref:DMT family transporter n=1 Tax=Yersinia intermedia TaxID=631 RepID=UPI0005ACE670|nr:DMT family transporter [Yersinia intermedia]AJJ19559.1 eamA-like transporter family protein [Yersinia intermedia]MDA5510776.1 DMT family transporter [Yersinia intermedia]CNH16584.1 putative inner membrane protein [Yersinia intermedia]CNI89461.1 putative inner membrane protein [Yersinia intermedia]CQD74101.1 putative inner membrane protein [Yersinia intermedia]